MHNLSKEQKSIKLNEIRGKKKAKDKMEKPFKRIQNIHMHIDRFG